MVWPPLFRMKLLLQLTGKREGHVRTDPHLYMETYIRGRILFFFLKRHRKNKRKEKALALMLGCLYFIVCLQGCPESLIPFHHNTSSNHFFFKGRSVATYKERGKKKKGKDMPLLARKVFARKNHRLGEICKDTFK